MGLALDALIHIGSSQAGFLFGGSNDQNNGVQLN